MIVRKIKVTEYEYQPPINYVAGATEPDIQFQLTDYEIPSGATGRVYVGRPDGTFEYTVATISGNTVIVAPTSSMFSVKGSGAIQVTLYVNNEVVKNFAVPVYIHADLADDSAQEGSDVTGVFRAAEEQALADFAEDAEAKAAEVIESIPADYTALTEEVSELNERLEQISEVVDTETKDIYEYTPVEFNLGEGSWTNNGVTFTQNNDGTISAVGTNTLTSGIIFGIRTSSAELTISLTAGEKYRLTGCPAGGAASGGYSLTIRYASGGGALFRDIGEGVVFDVPETTTYKIHITVAQGLTIDKVFTPVLEKMTVVGQETIDVLTAKDDVAREGKVDKQQGVGNAGKVLTVGNDGVIRPTESSGITSAIKSALLACFRHVSFLDDDADYYGALESALNNDSPHTYSLSATFAPGNYIVYAEDSLDTLVPFLTVTYYEDAVGTEVSSDDYTLSGTLSIGNNSITVSYNGLTCTFNVNAIDLYNVFRWEYKTDGSGNLLRHTSGMYDRVIRDGLAVGVLTNNANENSNRRGWYVRKGKFPAYRLVSGTLIQMPFYPIPVPSTASKFTASAVPNTDKMAIYLYKYTEEPVYEEYHYERINDAALTTGTITQTFTPSENLFISVLHRPSGDTYTQEPEFTIVFE